MAERILITGGAGFIGSHVADELLAAGYRVRVFDALLTQVHAGARWPAYLDGAAERIKGDVRDPSALGDALRDVDAVIHLAARVGVGQSMYQVAEYTSGNQMGTAVLLEALAKRPVRRLVVASSMSIYGEGRYRDADGRFRQAMPRDPDRLRRREWEPLSPDGQPLQPAPTDEAKRPVLESNYALGKYAQERMCLTVAPAYGVSAAALRFFNVYGPRQALSNPYTGVLAIFAARLLNNRPPVIFEDGLQRRDFVHVRDIARACRLALERDEVGGAINIAGGQSHTVLDIAARLARLLGRPDLEPNVTGEYRVGDIRHCFADISLARQRLGYAPRITLDDGLEELARWLAGQVAEDHMDEALAELAAHGLTGGASRPAAAPRSKPASAAAG